MEQSLDGSRDQASIYAIMECVKASATQLTTITEKISRTEDRFSALETKLEQLLNQSNPKNASKALFDEVSSILICYNKRWSSTLQSLKI